MVYIFVALSGMYVYTIIYFFFDRLFQKKKTSALKRNIIIASLVACQVFIFYFRIPIISEISGFICTIIMFRCLFKYKSMYYLLVCAILNMILVFANIISTLIILNTYNIKLIDYKNNCNQFMYLTHLACFVFVVTLMYMAFFFISKKKVSCHIKVHEIVFYIILTFFEWVLLQYLIDNVSQVSKGVGIFVTILAYMFLDIYIACLLYKTSKGRESEQELRLVRQQANIQLSVYTDLLKKYHDTRAIAHDIRKHIRTLEELIEQNNDSTAKEYTTLLNKELDKLCPQFIHNNQILTVIVNDNLFQAQKRGIKINLDMDDIDIDFISDLDITSIFANLFDNAIEACSELDNGNRRIKLVMKLISNFLIINVSNPYKNIRTDNKGRFYTTKSNHEGIGLSNIRNAVNKYDGDFSIDVKSSQFIAKITIPYIQNME